VFFFLFCLGFVGIACRNNCLTSHFVTRTWTLLWQRHDPQLQYTECHSQGFGLGWVELGWVGLGWSMGVSYYNMNIVVVLSRVKYFHHSHVWMMMMMMMMMICMLWVLLCFTSSTSNSRAVFIEVIELMKESQHLAELWVIDAIFAHMTSAMGQQQISAHLLNVFWN
jgi:hypothetical protein